MKYKCDLFSCLFCEHRMCTDLKTKVLYVNIIMQIYTYMYLIFVDVLFRIIMIIMFFNAIETDIFRLCSILMYINL